MQEMLVNKAGNDDTNSQAKLIVELYQGELGKHYPLMNLEVPKYKLYPGYSFTSTTFTNEYEKYRINELIKVQSTVDENLNQYVKLVLDGRIVAKKQA